MRSARQSNARSVYCCISNSSRDMQQSKSQIEHSSHFITERRIIFNLQTTLS
uniref:Uncharacterized protein n=1 Tax=Arundo donax TaxID=35708 RepID=A0A0A9CWU5_ARUDO